MAHFEMVVKVELYGKTYSSTRRFSALASTNENIHKDGHDAIDLLIAEALADHNKGKAAQESC